MRKVFTLVLVMAIAMTSFAQVKSISRKSVKAEPVQTQSYKGFEYLNIQNFAPTRSILSSEEVELSQTYYDWQSNMGPRNFTAVWPDGFAVMCYTQSTNQASSDRGTGLAIWDPAVGEWEFTESHAEDFSSLPTAEQKTGFGSISRYKENGLVIAAHSANYCHLFFCEDFRNGSRDFSTVVTLPNELEPTWPVVQCSGENLDIVHVVATQYTSTDPIDDALRYYRYENGTFTANAELLEAFDANHMTGGGSNICYFMLYDPAKPNRVSIILNNDWSDSKAIISEDNGATWSERVFWQHPGINESYASWFFYPRWTNAEFDADDNLHIVYEYNGNNGDPGNGSYYPAIGGIGYWSEILPKNEMCLGGIGNVGEPFIMDTTYLIQDIYGSEWYWNDANHDPLPEYIGELEIVDNQGNVLPRESTEGNLPNNEKWSEHGSYNCGKAAFATFHMDGPKIYAFWAMICGDSESLYYNSSVSLHYLRLFGNMSADGGQTWEGTTQLLTDIINLYDEMVYCQVIPYVYTDADGDYLWLCYQNDQEAGTCVQEDESVWDNNFYRAVKVYAHDLSVGETPMTVATTMNVYPNPAQGSFRVQLNQAANVNIYNTVGQLVKTYNNVQDINVALESGIYFVNAGDQTMKVVVK